MAKVLITGASGFVGSNLARSLLSKGHEITLLLRQDHTPWRIRDIRQDVRIEIADICDADTTGRVVRNAKAQWIFHLAAHGAYSWQRDIMRILQTNVMGTANLIHACIKEGFEVFVNTGSSSEYGFKDHAVGEHEPLEPNSYYAVAKGSATMFCQYTARSLGLRIPTLRLYSAYGPFEEPTRLIPTLILNGLGNRLPPLVNPDVARDFIYVDDVVNAYFLAVTTRQDDPGAIYNVGSGLQTTIREVVDLACRLLNVSVEPQWGSMQERIWDTDAWVADTKKIAEQLGWRAACSLEHGLRKMIDWIELNSDVARFYRDRQGIVS